MADSEAIAQAFYSEALVKCKTVCGQCTIPPSTGLLSLALPMAPPSLAFSPVALAISTSQHTDLSGPGKVAYFRSQLRTHLAATNKAQAFQLPGDEPWEAKDVGQLLCELLVLRDVASVQGEVLAAVVAAVMVFGEDGSAVVCLLLAMRCLWGLGRAREADAETRWLAEKCPHAIHRAKQYVESEHFGTLQLTDLVQGL